MKKLLTLLVYGLAAALIAACSPATQQSPDAPAASGSAASGTRMVKDSSGNDVEIPAEVTKVAPTIGAFSAVTAMLGASNKIVAAATSALSPGSRPPIPTTRRPTRTATTPRTSRTSSHPGPRWSTAREP